MLAIKKPLALMISAVCGTIISGSALAADTLNTQEASKTLKAKGSEIEEVTVTGSYTTRSMNSATGLAMSLRETPQSVTIMTSQMIEDKGLTDMEQVLDHVPGVSKVGDASEFSIVYVRGFQLDAGVQVDGMITTTANSTYSGTISQGLDPVVAERVEVLKGAAGILSGLGEPSATVNMIRKRPTSEFKASVLGSAGSWDTYRTEADVSGALNEDSSIRGRLVGAYLDNQSFIDRYGREKSVVYGIIEGDLSPATKLSLALDNLDSKWTGVYNWSSNPAFYTDGTLIDHDVSYSTGQKWAYRNSAEWSVMPELEHTFNDDWKLKASYRYSEATIDVINATMGAYVDKATGNFVDPWATPYALHSDRTSDTQSFNIVTTGNFALFNRKHDLVLGYNYGRNKFTMFSTYADLAPYHLNDTETAAPNFSGVSSPYNASGAEEVAKQSGAYTTVRFSLADSVKLMAGGRLSDWTLASSNKLTGIAGDPVEKKNIFTPYAGIVYDVNNFLSVYTSYTGIFLPVTDRDASGNLLDPTEGTNTEAGVKLAFFDNDLNISAAIYEANKDNVSTYANLGKGPTGDWIYISVDGIKTKGHEVEIAGALTPEWNISGGYTHNTAKDKEGNVRTSYIPNDVFKITNTYKFSGDLKGFTLGGSARWQSYSYYDLSIPGSISSTGANIDITQKQPAYWLVDIMARYEINDALAVTLNADNIFNKFYNRSMWGYADYGDPRSASVSVKYKF